MVVCSPVASVVSPLLTWALGGTSGEPLCYAGLSAPFGKTDEATIEAASV